MFRVSAPQDVHQHAALHRERRDQGLVGRAAVEGHTNDPALGQQLQRYAVGVDQPPSRLGLGPGEDVLHPAPLHQVAVVQNGHVGADFLDDLHVVGDDDHGDAQAAVDVLDEPQDVPGGLGVQGRGGLVTQKELRSVARVRAMATRCFWPPESCTG